MGTATDPYQPGEARYRVTRRCLEVFARRANPCSLTTKGTLVVRDIDLFQELARVTEFAVNVSLISLRPEVWRRLEPHTPPTASRLRAVERLAAAGVRVNVFLAPILPGLTDHPEDLGAVIRAAADCGAAGVHPGVLRLGPGIKEFFLEQVGRHFPSLRPYYEAVLQLMDKCLTTPSRLLPASSTKLDISCETTYVKFVKFDRAPKAPSAPIPPPA